MKVKITKCSKSTYWYKKLVGKTFEVKKTGLNFGYCVINNSKRWGCYISFSDCSILNENIESKNESQKEQ